MVCLVPFLFLSDLGYIADCKRLATMTLPMGIVPMAAAGHDNEIKGYVSDTIYSV